MFSNGWNMKSTIIGTKLKNRCNALYTLVKSYFKWLHVSMNSFCFLFVLFHVNLILFILLWLLCVTPHFIASRMLQICNPKYYLYIFYALNGIVKNFAINSPRKFHTVEWMMVMVIIISYLFSCLPRLFDYIVQANRSFVLLFFQLELVPYVNELYWHCIIS